MKVKILIGLVVLIVLVLGVGGCSVLLSIRSANNELAPKKNAIDQSWSNVEVQLQRRADLIPNLVQTVKGYSSHEAEVLKSVADARSRLYAANAPRDQKIEAENQLSQTLRSINFLSLQEQYPNLKADEQFKALQYELAGTENRVQTARNDYNKALTEYNNARDSFPTVVFANRLGFPHDNAYFKADEGSRQAPKVDFGGK